MKKEIDWVHLAASFVGLAFVIGILMALLSLSGCVMIERTPYTEASMKTPDGWDVQYESTKDQDVEFERDEQGRIKRVKIRSSASAVESERHEARRTEAELMKAIVDKVPTLPQTAPSK